MDTPTFVSSLATVGLILAAMALTAAVETAVPLHPRSRPYAAHVAPNLALTFLTFATNLAFNAALVAALVAWERAGRGLLPSLALPDGAAAVVAVAGLDFSFYVAHRAMHRSPWLWRFHAVHHSDPAVDVTTTIRQHPGEGVVRYAFMAVFALALGVSPAAFAVYRVWSALHGLVEHANVRMPPRLDTLLSFLVSTPNMHKVHHSRVMAETNTNYANLFAVYDRLFRTFTPSARGMHVVYGLEGDADAASQTTAALLAMPFRTALRRRHGADDADGPSHLRSTAW